MRVMDNIKEALNAGIHVNIRLNMDAGNASDLLKLSDELVNRFQGYTNLGVYIAVIHEFVGKINAHHSQIQKEADFYAIRDNLKRAGLLCSQKKELPSGLPTNRCIADNDASETILPDGRTGRCEHFSESVITGNIENDERDRIVTQRWKERLSVPECNSCALYPRCVRLKMCEWNKDGCNELERQSEIQTIKEQMLAAYQKWKEENNEPDE